MIKGFKVKVNVYDKDGTPIALSGQRDATLNMEMAELETTTKESEGNKEVEAGEFSWNLDCDRLISDIGSQTDAIETAFFAREKVILEILHIATGKGYKGAALITSLSIEAPYQDAVTSSVSFIGSGPLTQITEVTP